MKIVPCEFDLRNRAVAAEAMVLYKPRCTFSCDAAAILIVLRIFYNPRLTYTWLPSAESFDLDLALLSAQLSAAAYCNEYQILHWTCKPCINSRIRLDVR